MGLDVESLLKEALEKAKAKAVAQAEQKIKEEAENRAAKVDAWKQVQAEKASQERHSRNKAGMDIAEDFVRELAGPFQRFATRDDAAKCANLRIVLRPGKSDFSPAYSVQIECPGTSPRTWHRATLEQLTETQKIQISRLQSKGGFFQSSPTEMLEEIIKLREYLMRVEKTLRTSTGEEATDLRDTLNKVQDILVPLQLPKD